MGLMSPFSNSEKNSGRWRNKQIGLHSIHWFSRDFILLTRYLHVIIVFHVIDLDGLICARCSCVRNWPEMIGTTRRD